MIGEDVAAEGVGAVAMGDGDDDFVRPVDEAVRNRLPDRPLYGDAVAAMGLEGHRLRVDPRLPERAGADRAPGFWLGGLRRRGEGEHPCDHRLPLNASAA